MLKYSYVIKTNIMHYILLEHDLYIIHILYNSMRSNIIVHTILFNRIRFSVNSCISYTNYKNNIRVDKTN